MPDRPTSQAPQPELTSPTLRRMIRAGVAAALPGVALPNEADKRALLGLLARERGLGALIALGRRVRELPAHPVLDALAGGERGLRTGVEVLGCWQQLERFGHTRHRTRWLNDAAPQRDASSVVVRHVHVDGDAIDRGNDLFIWGLLVGLIERSGGRAVSAWLGSRPVGVPLVLDGQLCAPAALDAAVSTHTVVLTWAPASPARPQPDPAAPGSSGVAALRALLNADLLRTWRVADAARALGTSTRSLQRTLRAQKTSFTEAVHQARIDAAMGWMRDPRLSLTEVAFCAGFADQAHFTRLFRRYAEVPPSAYRALLAP